MPDEVCLGACFVVFVVKSVNEEPDKREPFSFPVEAVPEGGRHTRLAAHTTAETNISVVTNLLL